ncbi:hypothetical protein DRO58_07860 [Candidatus Bathyarchaeota archaeon]|nr:MAG: hypothetical protein DRO58_07860 [Candidatus Bathyarchaeota archaeon]
MRAVVFDLDGTLIESPTDIKGMKESLIGYAVNLGLEKKILSTENTTVEIVEKIHDYLIQNGFSKSYIERALRNLNEIMDRFEMENVESVKAVEGARETLRKIKSLGLKIGILTRSCKAYCEKVLEITGMRKFVDAIEPRRDLLTAKPNPVSLFNLCSKMGVKLKDVVFFWRSPTRFGVCIEGWSPFCGNFR